MKLRRLALVTAVAALVGCSDCGDGGTATPNNGGDPDIGFRTEQDTGAGPCFGCFDDEGNCVSGNDDDACGEGGADCQVCDDGTACVDDGQCAEPPSCNSDNCDGCCNADDECVDGSTEASCGKDGGGCSMCPDGATCVAGGCVLGCGTDNCDGCCNAAGDCVTTTNDTECGANGGACADCTATATVCGGESCITQSCSETCAGCCAGETCIDAPSAAQCGTGGAACVACMGSATCNAGGMCEAPASANWNVVLLSADISPTKPDGAGWDSFSPNPEVFVNFYVRDAPNQDILVGRTSVVRETLTPIWNETVLTGVPAALLQDLVGFELVDEDDFFDDEICYVEFPVDPSMMNGMIIETACPVDMRTKWRWRIEPE